MTGKNSFILYTDIDEHLGLLDDSECGALFRAIVAYAKNGSIPDDLTPAAGMAFSFIRAQIDRNTDKWESIRQKRSEAGRAGAAATNRKRATKPANAHFAEQSPAKPAVNVSVPENANVLVPEIIEKICSLLNQGKRVIGGDKGKLRVGKLAEDYIGWALGDYTQQQVIAAARIAAAEGYDGNWSDFKRFCDRLKEQGRL